MSNHRILVMDCEPDVLECMGSALQEEGFIVDTLLITDPYNLIDHVSQIQLRDPDVVIYDLGPPPVQWQMSRCLWLLQHTWSCCPNYIFVTTNAKLPLEPKQGDRKYAVIVKPLDLESLVHCVTKLIKSRDVKEVRHA